MGDKLDNVLNSTMVLIVGAVIICSAAIPVVASQVSAMINNSTLAAQIATMGLSASSLGAIVGAAIVLAIVGLVIGIIRSYSTSDR